MTKKRILIIGGVAGGASAATKVRRISEDAEIIVFERGKYISFANCGLPYHIGGEICDRDRLLLQTPEAMKQRYNIDVRVESEVIKIDRENKTIFIVDKKTQREYSEIYDALILSPGAKPIQPPLPGIKNQGIFTLRNMDDMDAINNWIAIQQPKHAVVVGGGYIGLEMTEALRNKKINTTVVEFAKQVMGPIDPEMATPLHQELVAHGVDLRLENAVAEFRQSNDAKNINVVLGSGEAIVTDLVILAIGVKPEIDLAKNAALKIGELGGIVVNEYMQTNDPNIYALGDAIEVQDFVTGKPSLIPLAGPANRQARVAAEHIFGRNSIKYNCTQGTGVCKVFDLTVGMTGANEKTLKRLERKYEKIYLHALDHAGYYPNATPISLKLLFDPENGLILGAQAVGKKGVEKRIDVIATAIRAKFTVFDLSEEELSYAPPYGSAKDIVNYAGFVASNVMNGEVNICHAAEVINTKEDQVLIDVRTADEYACGTISGALNFPLDELRLQLQNLPKNKELLVFCKVGLRGYLAARILKQNGFKCKNLSGGYTTYLMSINNCVGATNKMAQTKTNEDNVENNASLSAKNIDKNIVQHINACGLQCPGPIQKLKVALDSLQSGEMLSILTTDPGFITDVPAWCEATGNTLVETVQENGGLLTTISKGSHQNIASSCCNNIKQSKNIQQKKMTIVVFSGDLDRVIAAFIIANGAIAMGFQPVLFFTFWGLNILRKKASVKLKKTLIEKMFGMMMPSGAKKLALSKMNMCGMGAAMIKMVMRKKNVSSLPDLIAQAQEGNAKLIACSMSMDVMGIKAEELIDGVELGGVASYINQASGGDINLFI